MPHPQAGLTRAQLAAGVLRLSVRALLVNTAKTITVVLPTPASATW